LLHSGYHSVRDRIVVSEAHQHLVEDDVVADLEAL
jgi:hypothetical protein